MHSFWNSVSHTPQQPSSGMAPVQQAVWITLLIRAQGQNTGLHSPGVPTQHATAPPPPPVPPAPAVPPAPPAPPAVICPASPPAPATLELPPLPVPPVVGAPPATIPPVPPEDTPPRPTPTIPPDPPTSSVPPVPPSPSTTLLAVVEHPSKQHKNSKINLRMVLLLAQLAQSAKSAVDKGQPLIAAVSYTPGVDLLQTAAMLGTFAGSLGASWFAAKAVARKVQTPPQLEDRMVALEQRPSPSGSVLPSAAIEARIAALEKKICPPPVDLVAKVTSHEGQLREMKPQVRRLEMETVSCEEFATYTKMDGQNRERLAEAVGELRGKISALLAGVRH